MNITPIRSLDPVTFLSIDVGMFIVVDMSIWRRALAVDGGTEKSIPSG